MEGFNRCVFLLWGSGDKTWAVDVALTDQNEEKAFQALRKRYSEIRGILGMLFYFKTLIVKRVEVCISHLDSALTNNHQFRFIHRTSNKFQVSLEQTTPEEPIHALEATSQDLAIAIDRQVSPSNFCYKANEEWIHELGCPAFNSITSSELYLDPETFCAVEAFYRLKDLIIWRQKIGWLSLFFTNPRAAREHRVLDGPGVKEKTVMHYEYVSHLSCEEGGLTCCRFLKVSQSLHDSRRYDTFPGLLVQESSAFEGWATGRMVCLLVGLAVPLVSVAKVALGSWEAAFTAGSFILAIPMVVFAVLKVS